MGVGRVAVLLALASWGLSAQAQWSGNLSVVSLYKSRGIDQDGRDQHVRPALQGGVRYDFASGWYVNNWNSTGRFGDAHVEMDLYAGFQGKLQQDWGYDLGYVHYIYPSEGSWNSGELYAGLSHGNSSLYVYRGMRKGVNRSDMYYLLSYSHPWNDKLSLTAALGLMDYGTAGLRSRMDTSIGVAWALEAPLKLTAQIQRANHRRDAWAAERDTRLVLGLHADF